LDSTGPVYAAPGYTVPMVGMFFYDDTNLTLPHNGGGSGQYFLLEKLGVTWGAQVNTVGELTDYVPCSVVPTQTPTPDPTQTPSQTQTQTQTQTPTPTTSITATPTPTTSVTATPTPTPTTSVTATPTPTLTVTPTTSNPLDGQFYAIATDAYSACYAATTLILVYDANQPLVVGDFLYQAPTGTNYWTIAEIQALLSTAATTFYLTGDGVSGYLIITSNGGDAYISSSGTCVTPTPTPTPTLTPSL